MKQCSLLLSYHESMMSVDSLDKVRLGVLGGESQSQRCLSDLRKWDDLELRPGDCVEWGAGAQD